MTDYDIYVSLLCLITYVMFVTLSVFCIAVIMKLSIKLIRAGAEDDDIIKEYERGIVFQEFNNFVKNVTYAISSVVFLALLLVFAFSLVVQYADEPRLDFRPTYRVVQTGSMAEKHEKNTYLYDNGLLSCMSGFRPICTWCAICSELQVELA